MLAIRARVRSGRLVLDEPTDLPEGTVLDLVVDDEGDDMDDAERAALALAEAVTRIADQSDPVPDNIWSEAAKHYDEQALSALVMAIGTINLWNRLNAATRQISGEWTAQYI